MAPDALRRFQTDARFEKAFARLDQLTRNDAVIQDILFVVDVVDEHIQRLDPLFQPFFKPFPFRIRQYPRDNVDRHNALGTFTL
ncbi:hypothetical protein D3C86_2033080 [compost metagenome]